MSNIVEICEKLNAIKDKQYILKLLNSKRKTKSRKKEIIQIEYEIDELLRESLFLVGDLGDTYQLLNSNELERELLIKELKQENLDLVEKNQYLEENFNAYLDSDYNPETSLIKMFSE
tara:strand:- start:111 stop:464 length:354 start_codon:yes stop_codon:yes gene_type:complete